MIGPAPVIFWVADKLRESAREGEDDGAYFSKPEPPERPTGRWRRFLQWMSQ